MDETCEQVREKTKEEKRLDKIEQIAKVCHEVNRAYIKAITGENVPSWEDAPSWQTGSIKVGVEQALNYPEISPEELHDNWVYFKLGTGWTYGEEKNIDKKTHPSLIPYKDLPETEKVKDHLFRAVVNALRNT